MRKLFRQGIPPAHRAIAAFLQALALVVGLNHGGFNPTVASSPGGKVNTGEAYNLGSDLKAPSARERTGRRKKAVKSDQNGSVLEISQARDPEYCKGVNKGHII